MREMTIANQDQADHWNSGDDVGHWVNEQSRYDGMLAPFVPVILDAAGISGTDRVLDVGCGCGATTLAAARRAERGHAHGVDLSAPMLERARDDAERGGVTNATFEQADAQVHAFEEGAYDAVISRFGVMFFDDSVAAFANLHRAVRDDGRLAFVCWQERAANEWMTVPLGALVQHVPPPPPPPPGAPGMFGLAESDHVRRVLDQSGWRDISIDAHSMPLLVGGPGTLDDSVGFLRSGSMGRGLLSGADPQTQEQALSAMRAALAAHVTDDGVRLGSSVWLVTATA